MNTKPITPTLHGLIDFVFSGVLLAGPAVLRLNDGATKTYNAVGASILVGNAFTDTPVGLYPELSFKDHQKVDLAFLAGLSLFTLAKFIRKDKNVLPFHLGFLAAALANYVLTDYNAKSPQKTEPDANVVI